MTVTAPQTDETRVASSNRTDLQAAQKLFRDKQPEQALALARTILERDPAAEAVAKFAQAVVANLNALMKLAIRAGDHIETIRLAKRLIFEPYFAEPAQSALLAAMRQSLYPAERGVLLRELSQTGDLPESYWQEAGTVLGDLPPGPSQVAAGFDILRHVPGDETTLWALSGHLAALGLVAKVEPSMVLALFGELRAALNIGTGESADRGPDRATRREAYAELRNGLAPIDPSIPGSAVIQFAAEHAIQRCEALFQPVAAKMPLAESVWLLLDAQSEHYVLRNPQPISSAAALLFATPAPSRTPLFWRARIILSLWSRAISFEASQDRIGYLWLVLDPLIHVLIICIVPLLLHASQVADMNTFPFAIIGACFWLTFRTAATGALAGGGILKPQLEHPAVRRFDIIVARGLSAVVIYFFVGTALMLVTTYMGQSGFPVNLPLFLLCFVTSWMLGMAYGIIVHSLVLRYPGMRRINGFLIRFIAFTSGLFYVTEQLPDDVAGVALWNPLLHVVQLARSYWFYDYKTRDGDPIYVFYWFLALALLSLACIILDERRLESVRA